MLNDARTTKYLFALFPLAVLTVFVIGIVGVPSVAPRFGGGCNDAKMEQLSDELFTKTERGDGWAGTADYFESADTPFEAQLTSNPKFMVKTVKQYVNVMKDLDDRLNPDGSKDGKMTLILSKGYDATRNTAIFFAKYLNSIDYVYYFAFNPDSCKVNKMVKIWNDCHSVSDCKAAEKKRIAAK